MKKALLTCLTVAVAASSAMANDYKFVFDGDNDVYGLTRQTTTKEAELEFVKEVKIQEDGIDFSLTSSSETTSGFALINAGGTNAGLCVYAGFSSPSFTQPLLELTVPGGKITSVKIALSGSATSSLDVNINGVVCEAVFVDNLANFTWENSEGPEKVTIDWVNNYYPRYIHFLEVAYTPDLGGKEECGLKFSSKSTEAFLGEDFKAPVFVNPNKLPVIWTSSDEDVATVDNKGKVTLVGKGTTIIKVSTEGNEQYAAGNATYELTVIPVAGNLAQMLEVAPVTGDKVKVAFPMTVTFANGNFAFVIDGENNAGCIQDISTQSSTSTTPVTLYKVGNVIPQGWTATNETMYESISWLGIPDKVEETVAVEYPKVTGFTPEDKDRVVILENVTFTTMTAAGNTKAFGVTPDGATYEFQDTYNLGPEPAGCYDVTGVVRYSKKGDTVYFYMAPIAYAKASGFVGVDTVGTEEGAARYYNLHGCEVAEPVAGVYVKVSGDKVSKVVIR